MIQDASNEWGGWNSNEEEQLARWAALTPTQRLEWLEEAKAFLALVREARAKGTEVDRNGEETSPRIFQGIAKETPRSRH